MGPSADRPQQAAGPAMHAWALYAWANHAFATSVLVGLFPIFFARYWAAGLAKEASTLWLGLTNSGAALVVALLAPWLGTLADRRGTKKRFLAVFTIVGCVATAALAWVGAGDWSLAALLFGLASIGFFAGSSFHDALLVQVSTARSADRVSLYSYALGYLGGGLLFVLNVLMVLHPDWFGLRDKTQATQYAFVSVALWWALFALPLFLRVPEAPPTAETAAFGELWQTIRRVLRDAPVLRFLLAYWLYIDAVGTLQQMAVDFGAKLGFSDTVLIQALLMVQFISFPAALAFGPLAVRIGTRNAIYVGLAVFVGVTLWAYFMQTETQFYQMAAVVGLVQGGVQALSRSYFSRLIPIERAGEYFGFYNMLGKFAAVLGPAVVGLVAYLSGNPRLSILVLAVFFIAGAGLLSRVREPAAL